MRGRLATPSIGLRTGAVALRRIGISIAVFQPKQLFTSLKLLAVGLFPRKLQSQSLSPQLLLSTSAGGGALLLLLSPRTRLAEMGPRHLRSRVGCSAILNNRAAAAGGVGRDFPVSMLKMT